MARIPVEHENGGSKWWLWLIALLVIAGLIWLFAGLGEEEVEEPVVEGPITAPVEPPAGAVVMDLATVTTASPIAEFFGREVQLNNLYVTAVPSDRTFFVCSTEVGTPGQPVGQADASGELADPCTTEEVLVVLEENAGAGPTPPPGNQVEGAVNVNPGQMVTITNGRIQEYVRATAEGWGLDQEALDLAAQQEFYIQATGVNITAEASATAPSAQGADQQGAIE